MSLPQLVPVDGAGRELRFDPEALARAACAEPAGPPPAISPERGTLRAELMASPIAQRLGHIGAATGLDFVHHELRVEPRFPLDLGPELTVSDAGHNHPVWDAGHLQQPKYFSGFLESPRCRYVPGHRIEWRTHEVAHRLAGFFWRADMSRFEFYVGARVSELFPVVHWYGLDDVGRPRCAEHVDEPATRRFCAACEAQALRRITGDAAAPSLARAVTSAEFALSHWRRECGAIERELETGRMHSTPFGHLDGASDAVGYLRGHWNRVTSWSFGAWVERFGGPSGVIGHAVCVGAQLEHVSSVFRGALGPVPELDRAAAERSQKRRRLADLGYRVAVALEDPGLDDLSETALLEALDRATELDRGLADGEEGLGDLETEIEGTLRVAARRQEGAQGLFALGEADSHHPAGFEQLMTGLAASLPATFGTDAATQEEGASEDEMDRLSAAHAVANAASFWTRGPLPSRAVGADLGYFGRAAAVEAWLLAQPHADLEAERFGALPESSDQLGSGRLRANTTLRSMVVDPAAAAAVLDLPLSGPAELIAVYFDGEPRVLESNAAYRAALESASDGRPTRLEEDDALAILLDAGFVVWFPPVRRGAE